MSATILGSRRTILQTGQELRATLPIVPVSRSQASHRAILQTDRVMPFNQTTGLPTARGLRPMRISRMSGRMPNQPLGQGIAQ
jgi:hypothetical protein